MVIVGVALLINVWGLAGMKASGEYGGAELESVTMKVSNSELSNVSVKSGGGGMQECASLGLYSSQVTIPTSL